MIRPISTFLVSPTIPAELQPLVELSRNYWWCWNSDAIELWSYVDPELWRLSHHNPVVLLQRLTLGRISELVSDETFGGRMAHVHERFRTYMETRCGSQIAYFCAEFGIHESFQMYSGGLGVLAGDHIKSASDLAVPLVGVGLLYQEGYFRQYLTDNGWQNEQYQELDFHALPIERVLDINGQPLYIHVDMPLGRCYATVWKVAVGRVSLYLLDSNVDQNTDPTLRDITDRLYGGTTDTRIMQEMLLGIGGMRALESMGIDPSACHINEGHAAFSMIERTRQLMSKHHMTFAEAWKLMQSCSVFTTHTPVPAGNEEFDVAALEPYFRHYVASFGCSWEEFVALGNRNGANHNTFSMTILGIRGSWFRNGVSELHGQVAREMWNGIWSGFPVSEVPISGLVNGVHTKTWVSPQLALLYDSYLGEQWRLHPESEESWSSVKDIPDTMLWDVHCQRRARLVDGVRKHVIEKHHASLTRRQALTIHECLSPEALTIGFARRFATYKRADLLTRDMDRLARIITNADKPVQVVLAGKAHPRDVQGKELIQKVHRVIREFDLENSIVFLEDYEMDVARLLIRGCDVWLNTPRRPHEASGTSGMKAALNGVLHCSILDGWWAEAYNGKNGWAVGHVDMQDDDEQDIADSTSLYDLLEFDIVPRFYKRDDTGIPYSWLTMMKESIVSNAWRYSSERMVQDYATRAYLPSIHRGQEFRANNAKIARDLVSFEKRLRTSWDRIRITTVDSQTNPYHSVGDMLHVRAGIELGPFSTDEVEVQLISGPVNEQHTIEPESITSMKLNNIDGTYAEYTSQSRCQSSGFYGCTVRVLPRHSGYVVPVESGYRIYPDSI